jgi:ABC-2 type transport system permease protein
MNAHGADAVLRIPGDFSRRLAAGDAAVQVLVQGSDPTRALAVGGYLQAAVAIWQQKAADREGGNANTGDGGRNHAGIGSAGSGNAGSGSAGNGSSGSGSAGSGNAGASNANSGTTGAVTVVDRMWFNAANDSTWYLVPGLIVLIMTLIGAFLTALVMAREWERGTLEALFVTPVRPAEVLLAKIIPYFCVGLVGLVLCLLAARWLFEVPVQGSLWIVLLASMLYLVVAVGMGLLISSVTKNQFIASQVALLASFMPSMMLSGFLFDLRNVPAAVRYVGNALPATYFMELIKTLFLAGDVWPLILRDCAVLAAYAAVLLGAARAVTHKRLD